MCLILFAYEAHPSYGLVLGANRDEFYDRPTRPAAFWEDAPHLFAGRDLTHGGTWLGVTRTGRFAAVTNYRDPLSVKLEAPSRGHLVGDFLKSEEKPGAYLARVARRGDEYNGFNLLAGDRDSLYYYSNRGGAPRRLGPGVYGLSNHLLDTAWPKVEAGKRGLAAVVGRGGPVEAKEIFRLLADEARADDALLPETGVGLEMERVLSPLFIISPRYGTRSSTVLLASRNGRVRFVERTHDPYTRATTESRCEFIAGLRSAEE